MGIFSEIWDRITISPEERREHAQRRQDRTAPTAPTNAPASRTVDVEAVLEQMAAAKGGDVPAARELLQRLLGPPEAIDLINRLHTLEQQLAQLASNREEPWRS